MTFYRCSSKKASLLSVLLILAGCARPPAETKQEPPAVADPLWKWSDQRIRDLWPKLGAGPSLKPASWPGGAVVAVALSFDYQMGTIYDDKNPATSTSTNSQYEGRGGLPRNLRRLDKSSGPKSY